MEMGWSRCLFFVGFVALPLLAAAAGSARPPQPHLAPTGAPSLLETASFAPPDPPPRPRPSLAPSDGCPCADRNNRILNVLTLNLLRDLTKCPYPLQRCVEALADMIRDYEVDIATFQETNLTRTPSVLDMVWQSLNRTHPKQYQSIPGAEIITRLPAWTVVKREGSARASGALLQVVAGVNVYVFTCHLPAYPYGPFLLRDGLHPSTVRRTVNAVQLREMQTLVNRMFDLSEQVEKITGNQAAEGTYLATSNSDSSVSPNYRPGDPRLAIEKGNHAVLLTGDFNIPSHRDHDVDTMNDGNYTAARRAKVVADLEWPVTKFLEEYGFTDAYRQKYPSAVLHRGFTWSAMPSRATIMDRIDYIMFRERSPVYGEREPHVKIQAIDVKRIEARATSPDGAASDLFSDHLAVFARLKVTWPVEIAPPPRSNAELMKERAAVQLSMGLASSMLKAAQKGLANLKSPSQAKTAASPASSGSSSTAAGTAKPGAAGAASASVSRPPSVLAGKADVLALAASSPVSRSEKAAAKLLRDPALSPVQQRELEKVIVSARQALQGSTLDKQLDRLELIGQAR